MHRRSLFILLFREWQGICRGAIWLLLEYTHFENVRHRLRGIIAGCKLPVSLPVEKVQPRNILLVFFLLLLDHIWVFKALQVIIVVYAQELVRFGDSFIYSVRKCASRCMIVLVVVESRGKIQRCPVFFIRFFLFILVALILPFFLHQFVYKRCENLFGSVSS